MDFISQVALWRGAAVLTNVYLTLSTIQWSLPFSGNLLLKKFHFTHWELFPINFISWSLQMWPLIENCLVYFQFYSNFLQIISLLYLNPLISSQASLRCVCLTGCGFAPASEHRTLLSRAVGWVKLSPTWEIKSHYWQSCHHIFIGGSTQLLLDLPFSSWFPKTKAPLRD